MMAIEETDAILFRLAWQWKRPPGKMRSTMDDEVVWQDTRLGDKRKVELLEESMGFTKSSYSKSGVFEFQKGWSDKEVVEIIVSYGLFWCIKNPRWSFVGLPDRICVNRSDDGEVIATGVGILRGGWVGAKMGGSDDEVHGGNLTGDWINSGTRYSWEWE